MTTNTHSTSKKANHLIHKTSLLFVHGNSLNSVTWDKQHELTKHCELTFIDLPGHGFSEFSETPETTYSVDGYVSSIVDVAKKLDAERLILIGHSLGGHLVVNAASKIDNLVGIVAMGAPFLGMPPAMDRAFLPNPSIGYGFQGKLDDAQCMDLALAFWSGDNPPYWIKEAIKNTDPNARAYLGQSMAQGKMYDELKILKSLQVPIAIFHGKNDTLVRREYFDEIEIPTLWKNQVHDMEGGHCFFYENPRAFNALLEEFIAFNTPS